MKIFQRLIEYDDRRLTLSLPKTAVGSRKTPFLHNLKTTMIARVELTFPRGVRPSRQLKVSIPAIYNTCHDYIRTLPEITPKNNRSN